MTKQQTREEIKKLAFKEALQKAISKIKPKTPEELESIVQVILHKLESKKLLT